ncbi:putative U1 small nuclear ribonucleoprotein C [[Candida] jaroonii]|uniref:U1 small nuclear ribonucleoprotein C n=1 Tax=[Candida] jaroonii TaxID=467808 RepID=A0ACA9YEC8_9ASCO|nr:putative U1 small nuclear ribonucleoprotein C [[Candida] jaroonii]
MRFYCEYCKSYLTHDTQSVRQSHLQGKNHIKLYCQYYLSKAQENDIKEIINPDIELSDVVKQAPGFDGNLKFSVGVGDENDNEFKLPPPQVIKGYPNPPPSILHNEKDKEGIVYLMSKN